MNQNIVNRNVGHHYPMYIHQNQNIMLCLCMCARAHASVYGSVCVCVSVRACVRACVCACVRECVHHASVCLRIYVSVCLCVCVQICFAFVRSEGAGVGLQCIVALCVVEPVRLCGYELIHNILPSKNDKNVNIPCLQIRFIRFSSCFPFFCDQNRFIHHKHR